MGVFEDKLGCVFCRDHGLWPGEGQDQEWQYHLRQHIVDKLEPACLRCGELVVSSHECVDALDVAYPLDRDVSEQTPSQSWDGPEVLTVEEARAAEGLDALGDIETFEDVFAKIYEEAFDLLIERQRKYGPENIRRLGLYGVFSRLSFDKVERVARSFNGKIEHGVLTTYTQELADEESFEDALIDIANYALIMLALKRGLWGRPLREELDG